MIWWFIATWFIGIVLFFFGTVAQYDRGWAKKIWPYVLVILGWLVGLVGAVGTLSVSFNALIQ